jgi:carbamoyl-phosphate synthase large subunit
MKAIRSLEQHTDSLLSYDFSNLSDDEFLEQLATVDDLRIWRIAEAIRRHLPYEQIHDITKIDIWFIDKIAVLVGMEYSLKSRELTKEMLYEAKRLMFPDSVIASLSGKKEAEVKALRREYGIHASFKNGRYLCG